METFLMSFELWNFVIAVLALTIALYSVYYTRKNDKHSIEITDSYVSFVDHRPTLIMFNVLNNSNSSIKVVNVELLNADGSLITPLNYEPEQKYTVINDLRIPDAYNKYDYSFPFESPEIVPPYESTEFRYYLDPYRSDMKIRITCNQPIHRFRKSKLFSAHFRKFQ